jgi:hypothetical protein
MTKARHYLQQAKMIEMTGTNWGNFFDRKQAIVTRNVCAPKGLHAFARRDAAMPAEKRGSAEV